MLGRQLNSQPLLAELHRYLQQQLPYSKTIEIVPISAEHLPPKTGLIYINLSKLNLLGGFIPAKR